MKNILQTLVKLLLALHKNLLDQEKKIYESKNGPITNNNDYFNLVISHADFKWLRALSEIISMIDEESEQESINKNKIKDLLNEIVKILTPNQNKGTEITEVVDFSYRYSQALTANNDLVIMDREIKKAIGSILKT